MKIFNIIIGLVIVVFLGLGLFSWRYSLFFGPGGEEKFFVVEKGENFVRLAKRLHANGIIQNERVFRWYVNIVGSRKSLRRGEFLLQEGMSIREVLLVLTEGKPVEHKFTVPEGHNIYQIAQNLEQANLVSSASDFLNAVKSPELIAQIPTFTEGQKRPASIEGYIYPDTYHLQKVFSAKEIATIMFSRFKEIYKQLAPEFSSAEHVRNLGMSAHDVITLASIVEKETGAAVERPLIASVFINRLYKKMRLQTDPTIIYGILDRDGRFDGNIRRRDISAATAYNTYAMHGLPPGPIANPGMNAIQAVLNPAQSDYFFFVSRNNGTHIFSKNFREHQRAVRETQLKPGVKVGKSWRDLPKEERAN